MANHLDMVTGKPVDQWYISPPEIHVASNGYVLRTYDVATDQQTYRVATDAEGVRQALHAWADVVCGQLRASVERELSAKLEKPR